MVPILVGPADKIRHVAQQFGLEIGQLELVDVPHSHAAAAKAVELVRAGRAELLMKGSLHTDELMSEVVAKGTGLRTRVSMMRIVDDLEARKLAVRRAVPGDRRLRAVELTEHGREVFHTAEKTAREISEALLAHLEPAERTALTGLLSRFLQATDT